MVDTRPMWPQLHREGIFAVRAIAVDIAQVVDVERRCCQQTTDGGRQHHHVVKAMRL